MKEYLPIGTVVVLNKGEKKLMIYGRKQINIKDNVEYDYVSCLYPEGNINKDYYNCIKRIFNLFSTLLVG